MNNGMLSIKRIQIGMNGKHATGDAVQLNGAYAPVAGTKNRGSQDDRIIVHGLGGSGGRVAVQFKALAQLDGRQPSFLSVDSDNHDRYTTALPDGTLVQLSNDERAEIGLDDALAELRKRPAMLAQFEPMLRGITVAQTNGHGAGQHRPVGALQYLLNIEKVMAAMQRVLDRFVPRWQTRSRSLDDVHQEQLARAQAELPLIDLHIAGTGGGQGSAIFLPQAYLSRWLMDARGAKNVTRIGVLLGPRAFIGRGGGRGWAHNYVATLRELDHAYRHGFRMVLPSGQVIESNAPPFDLLFAIDLPEWPQGEMRFDEPNAKLSDTAMDDWLRQVATSLHLLTSRAMHDRLRGVLLNEQASPGGGASISVLNGAFICGNLAAMEEAIALGKTRQSLTALLERCE